MVIETIHNYFQAKYQQNQHDITLVICIIQIAMLQRLKYVRLGLLLLQIFKTVKKKKKVMKSNLNV